MAGARILVLKQDGLRSFIEAEPAFAAIRQANPGIPIDLLTTAELGRLAKGAPYFDRVLAAEKVTTKAALKSFVSQLKRVGYEQIYDLDASKTTMDIRSAMRGFRGPRWIGPTRQSQKTSRSALAPGPSLTASGYERLMRDAKIGYRERLPDLSWSLKGRKNAANMEPAWFGIGGPFALFIASQAEERRWASASYAALAKEMRTADITAVIVGDEGRSAFAQEVLQKAGAGVIDLCGKTDLAQLAMLADRASFFVAGPAEELHLCLSLECPGLVLLTDADKPETESLVGRDMIRLTAPDMASLSPEMAITMLRNMGLLPQTAVDPLF